MKQDNYIQERLEEFDEEFNYEHGGSYFGKDSDDLPIYIPYSALDELKQFLTQTIKDTEQRVRQELVEKLWEVQWNPQKPKPHMWSVKCDCDGCKKNNEIQDIINLIKE